VSRKTRRFFTAQKRAAILRQHHVDIVHFIAGDFKEYIRLTGMTHVRTARNYPQSNGKIERWHKTLKGDAIRVTPPESLDEARRVVARFVEPYNHRPLHSAIDDVTPADRLAGCHPLVTAARDAKLEAARQRRAAWRQAARQRHSSASPAAVIP
jgi:transposase InsO family protein